MTFQQFVTEDFGPEPKRLDEFFRQSASAADLIQAWRFRYSINWEGVGVEPDVKVASTDALETAQKLAVEKIHQKDGAR